MDSEDYRVIQIYNSAIYNANDIIILFSGEGKILKVNKKAIEAYGYSEEELLSMSIFQLRNKENPEALNARFDKAKTDGIEFQLEHYRKDGSYFYVEVKAVSIEFDNEKFVLSIARDITNRIKSEQEVRRLVSIVEDSQDAIIGKDLDGIITTWNKGAEKLYGYTKEEAIGKHSLLVIPKEKTNDFYEIMSKIRKGNKVEGYETIRKKKNGDIIDVFVTVSPIFDLNGNFIGASNITRYITESKKVQRELENSEEKYRSLYSSISEGLALHEIILNDFGEPVDYKFLDMNESFDRIKKGKSNR